MKNNKQMDIVDLKKYSIFDDKPIFFFLLFFFMIFLIKSFFIIVGE